MLKLLLSLNAAVAGLTGAATLVVLLIAPLGLAAVLTCTLLVVGVTFAAGLAADLVIWRRVQPQGSGATGTLSPDHRAAGNSLLPGRRPRRLPER